jgi:hypothetical protein
MTSLADGLFLLARKLEVVRLLVLDFVTKITSEFQESAARRLKIEAMRIPKLNLLLIVSLLNGIPVPLRHRRLS